MKIPSILGLLALHGTAFAQSIFSGNGETAWAQYHKQIVDFLGGNGAIAKPMVLQTLAVAQRAEWDGKSEDYNLFLKQTIGNTQPEWGPVYLPGVTTVSNGYQSFLDRLNWKLITGSPIADKKKLDELNSERERLRAKLDTLKTKVDSRWLAYVVSTPPSLRLTRAQWEQENGYTADKENLHSQLQATQAAYMLEVNTVAGPDLQEVGRALAKIGNPIQQMPLPSTEELIEMGKESWEFFFRTFLIGNIFDFKAENAPVSFTMKSGVSETDSFSKSWNASARAGWCFFFSVSGSTEHEEKSKKTVDETTEIKVSFKNIKPFNIQRGQWFDGNLMKKFINRVEPSFWGPTGELSLIPQQVILGHGLTVEINASKDVSDYIYERHHTSGGGGFRIGPFGFGGRGSTTTTHEHTKIERTATGLKMEDTSGRAFVIAVISLRPADLLAPPPPDAGPMFLMPSANRLSREELSKGIKLLEEAQKPPTPEAPIQNKLLRPAK